MIIKLIKPSYEIDMLGETGIEKLKRIEKVARLCYKTEDKITDTSYEKLVRFLVDKKHEAMLEMSDISVKFIANRAFTHELVRHRIASFAQESQRYVGYGNTIEFIIPPWCTNIFPNEFDISSNAYFPLFATIPECRWISSCKNTAEDYSYLLNNGWKPEQARSVLPNATKTEIVIRANAREWRNIFHLRDSKFAGPEMQELMAPLHIDFQKRIPILFEV